ncbi:hypothetical protein E9549_18030 [Blastococcus sp. MG754426]|uniref:hypothetical protein n=1 Tax=unclassified Blastococcus TaxID=2619396 RepID=UPI001EF07162|nr:MULTISPECIES: hypothetical protein [unclassified Blastococcus]MCF6509286.1 hypothetical protein [Blastococcus sp. MG754426]MCF6513845.1 hypothetical protein [Blastococcus sp. MG754427]
MTSNLVSPSATTTADTVDGRPVRSAGSRLLPIAGGALIAGSLLYVAGMATSPPQASMANEDYLAALARDEGRTALSAMLLHYGNLALALAWLAAPALVRGRRGSATTITGALLSAIGLVSVTVLVLFDHWTGAIGRELDPATALALFEDVSGSAAVGVAGTLTLLGLLGPLVVYAGLARAGVTSWWLLVPALAALGLSASMAFEPLPFAAFALVGAVPAVVIGLRMIQRHRAETATATA